MNKTYPCLVATLIGMASSLLSVGAKAEAGSPFLGQILWVPYNFAPVGWALCDGQLLPISQNTALFSLLGTTYGGNGRTNFALPNLGGRLLVQAGQGPGLSAYALGQSGGAATHTLTQNELPSHNHQLQVSTDTASTPDPSNHYFAATATGKSYGPTGGATLAPDAVAAVGGGQPHNNMMPYTALTCIIATQGVFPPRP